MHSRPSLDQNSHRCEGGIRKYRVTNNGRAEFQSAGEDGHEHRDRVAAKWTGLICRRHDCIAAVEAGTVMATRDEDVSPWRVHADDARAILVASSCRLGGGSRCGFAGSSRAPTTPATSTGTTRTTPVRLRHHCRRSRSSSCCLRRRRLCRLCPHCRRHSRYRRRRLRGLRLRRRRLRRRHLCRRRLRLRRRLRRCYPRRLCPQCRRHSRYRRRRWLSIPRRKPSIPVDRLSLRPSYLRRLLLRPSLSDKTSPLPTIPLPCRCLPCRFLLVLSRLLRRSRSSTCQSCMHT